MRFFTTDLYGQTLLDPSAPERRRLLESVIRPGPDVDYPDVYLSHAEGMTLIYREGGIMVCESPEGFLDLLREVGLEEAGRIWDLLVNEDWLALRQLRWERVEVEED
jgi:hypothetical protein